MNESNRSKAGNPEGFSVDQWLINEADIQYFDIENYAMESIVYATHLARHDDQQSDFVYFLQGDPFHHQLPFLFDVSLKMVRAGTASKYIDFLHLNNRRFLGSSHSCILEVL